MPTAHHFEQHFRASATVRDIVIGMSDGLLALFIFGYVKGRFTGLKPVRGGLRTLLIGGLAAGAAFTIAKLIA